MTEGFDRSVIIGQSKRSNILQRVHVPFDVQPKREHTRVLSLIRTVRHERSIQHRIENIESVEQSRQGLFKSPEPAIRWNHL